MVFACIVSWLLENAAIHVNINSALSLFLCGLQLLHIVRTSYAVIAGPKVVVTSGVLLVGLSIHSLGTRYCVNGT